MAKDIEGREVTLSLLDRVVLMNTLPTNGNRHEMRDLCNLRTKIALSDAECDEFQVLQAQNRPGRLAWQNRGTTKTISMTSTDRRLCRDVMIGLHGRKALSDAHLDLYDLFVEEGKQA